MDFDHPPADPVEQLRIWLREAAETDLPNPTAMSLATVDPDGRPSSRIVLMKGLDERGVVFYSNRQSRKGAALAVNPRAGLLFHWDPLHRQVAIEGRVEETSDEESDAYFASRPRGSQLAAWASRQSEPVASRAVLDEAYAEAEKRFEDGDVTRPPHWGGYRVSIDSIVFWQARPFRLHDRVRYVAGGGQGTTQQWTMERLFP